MTAEPVEQRHKAAKALGDALQVVASDFRVEAAQFACVEGFQVALLPGQVAHLGLLPTFHHPVGAGFGFELRGDPLHDALRWHLPRRGAQPFAAMAFFDHAAHLRQLLAALRLLLLEGGAQCLGLQIGLLDGRLARRLRADGRDLLLDFLLGR
jgi:hypothetical protein